MKNEKASYMSKLSKQKVLEKTYMMFSVEQFVDICFILNTVYMYILRSISLVFDARRKRLNMSMR